MQDDEEQKHVVGQDAPPPPQATYGGTNVERRLRLLTFNVCYSRKASGESQFTAFAQHTRLWRLLTLIESARADVVFLQEVHADLAQVFRQFLIDRRYSVLLQPHGGRDFACVLLVAFRANAVQQLLLRNAPIDTVTTGTVGHFFRGQYGPYAQLVQLGAAEETVLFVNSHLPMHLDGRLHVTADIARTTAAFLKTHPRGRVLVAGDMNTFPDDGGAVQLQTLETVGRLQHVPSVIVDESNARVTQSFTSYPFDTFQGPYDILDHCFCAGFAKIPPNLTWVNKHPAAFFVNGHGNPQQRWFVSDHYALAVDFWLAANDKTERDERDERDDVA